MKNPNIIFIVADDMGYGDFSAFNYGASHTPVLDELIRDGVCLTQHYSASAVCAPARAGLLTGRYPQRTGVIDTLSQGGMDSLDPRERTMGDYFQRAGYRTGLIGKWHCGPVHAETHPNNRGFDEFIGFRAGGWGYYNWGWLDVNGSRRKDDGRYLTDVFTDDAIDFVSRHREEPFFLHLAYNAPHHPLQAPEDDVRPFLESGNFNKAVSTIYGMLQNMDRNIGRLRQTLRDLGLEKDTILIFTSDNGPQFGCGEGEWRCDRFNCGFRGSKGSVCEGGIRVPLILHWPGGMDGGRNYHDLVHFVDWLPTLADACNITLEPEQPLDGQSVLPALRGKGDRLNPRRFWQWSRYQPVPTHNAAMRDGPWKLVMPGVEPANIFSREDAMQSGQICRAPEQWIDRDLPAPHGKAEVLDATVEAPMLFNIDADPHETTNLADTQTDRVLRMRRDLESWFESVWHGPAF